MSNDENPVTVNARRVLDLLSTILPTASATISSSRRAPVIIGLTGLQGSGKSTWASSIVSLLRSEHGLNAITVSLDDFYKTHDELVALRDMDKANRLFRTRGQPGTHDEQLAQSFFASVKNQADCKNVGKHELKIPSFDKSQYDGQGDRAPEHLWPTQSLPIDVVVFEGWCVGFQPLPDSAVREKHRQAVKTVDTSRYSVNTLANHDVEHLLQLNRHLARYNASFMGSQCFDCLVHLDTDNLANVYTWRIDQETALRKRTGGQGMTDEAVMDFVKGYMPAYELYLEQLRNGFFANHNDGTRKKQIRVCLDEKRRVVECVSL